MTFVVNRGEVNPSRKNHFQLKSEGQIIKAAILNTLQVVIVVTVDTKCYAAIFPDSEIAKSYQKG